MKKIVKTASIVTSGIIVGALVRKYAQHGPGLNKQSTLNSIRSVKSLFTRSNISEDLDNYFV